MVENEDCLKKEQVTKEQAGDVELVRNDNEIEWFKSSFGRMYRTWQYRGGLTVRDSCQKQFKSSAVG